MSIPDPYASIVQQAFMQAQQGDREGALAALYSVVSAEPDHRNAWWLIAQIAPRPDQQQQALRRVLEIDPTYGPARDMAARLWPTEPPAYSPPASPASAPNYAPTPRTPPAQAGPPPARDYVSHPEPNAYEPRPPYERQPTPEGYRQPAYTPPPEPALAPYYPEREKAKRAADFVRPTGRLQPFLIFNGGCASGCLATLLTTLVFAVLAFLILRDAVGVALRTVGALTPGEAVPASLIPAMVSTAVLQLLRTNPIALPINLSGLIPGLDPTLIPQMPTSTQIFSDAMGSLWQSMGYPPQTGDLIVGQMSSVGPQIANLSWILPLLFMGGWVVLAFFLVFLRARSVRFIHWLLATVGMWLIGGAAYGLALVIYQIFGGGAG